MIADIQWWCSARGERWTWAWRGYPGVWAFVLLFAWVLWRLQRDSAPTRGERAMGVGAIVLLWLTLDWPVGPLGAGYLASVHGLQFVMLGIVIPALLLASTRRVLRARAAARPGGPSLLARLATQPVIAAATFAIVMTGTHAPLVVDNFMRTQIGAFLLDAVWLGAGLMLWWPVIVRVPDRPWFNPLGQMLYLFLATQAHVGLATWLLIAQFPVYGTYELAPRVVNLSALQDQQVAGAVMLGIAGPIVLAAISLVFFRWIRVIENE